MGQNAQLEKFLIDPISRFPQNTSMLPPAKALWSFHVWMTAFTILFANISPCQCVCPNGNRKLFCLGMGIGTNACCCNGAEGCCSCGACGEGARPTNCSRCAPGPRVKTTEPRCCCCRSTSSLRTKTIADPSHVEAQGCKRTLSQAKIVACARKVSEVIGCSAAALLPESSSRVLPMPTTCRLLSSRERCHSPPPTDRIVAFQHFII